MDANLIYEKTPAGEDAVRQRTKLVQRNTRMVLILVDGNASVADLCEKTGNAQMVESALADLERDGLISPKMESDSVWEQSRKVAEEIRAAAVSRLGKEREEAPAAERERMPQPAAVEPSLLEPFSMAPHSIFSPAVPGGTPQPNFGGDSKPPTAPAPAVTRSAAPEAKPLLERLASFFPARARQDDDSISPIRRGPRGPYISWPLKVAIAIVAICALLGGSFMLYPYASHRAAMEAALSRYLGQPVSIGDVSATFSPVPAIVLDRVATKSGDLQATSVVLVPEVFSLLGSRPVFSSVRIDNARISDGALAGLSAALTRAAAADAPATLHRLQFSHLEAGVMGLALHDLQGEVRLAPNAPVTALEFMSSDRATRVTMKAQDAGFLAEFEGYGWKPAAESAYQFDSIQGQAVWDGRSLSVRSLDARIFDGSVQGVLLFDAGAKPTLAGDLTIRHMNIRRLSDALGQGALHEGELAGDLRFSGAGARWSDVLAGASGEGGFSITRGVLGGFDLAEAVRRGGRTPLRGGTTRYEQATGRVRVSAEAVRLSDLAINAGLLKSAGTIEIAHDGKLGGRLDVEMRGSASVARMAVGLS